MEMAVLLGIALVSFGVAPTKADLASGPVAGSRLPLEKNQCMSCHGDSFQWEGPTLRLYTSKESLAEDVHFRKGVNCHDCHGGDPNTVELGPAHAVDLDAKTSKLSPFRKPLADVWKECGKCHRDPQKQWVEGRHAPTQGDGRPTTSPPPDCRVCHGPKAHGMLPVRDNRSPVALANQVRLCGECHAESLSTYEASPHGRGLQRSGLVVSAVCADCHGAHGVEPAANSRSPLHGDRVAATCGKCHGLIGPRLAKSVHARETSVGKKPPAGAKTAGTTATTSATATTAAPATTVQRIKPQCIDCHRGHDPSPKDSALSRLASPDNCGGCHAELSSGYAISMHGALTELGYGPAARCSDCHGSHDILPATNPDSTLSSAHRGATCGKCHANAPPNFLDFDPHADHRDPARSRLLHGVYLFLMTLLFTTFGVAGLHSVLWFVRSLIHVRRHGRPRALVPGTIALRRFGPFHRIAHTVMVLSFLGLALTGLPLKYHQHGWAQVLAHAFGGFESTGAAHRLLGAVNIACLAVYVVRMAARFAAGAAGATGAAGAPGGGSRMRVVFGPDSPVPSLRDVRDSARMMRWFFGLGPKPTFERWTYWEKFDFWGACADIVIIGATGLILWFPNQVCALLPGETLNFAKVIHSTQALLATGFVFTMHFFATHLRPEKFPMDMSMLTGLVSEEELREERPEYIQRMREEGKLDALAAVVPPRDVVSMLSMSGFVALLAGLGLLVGILVAVLSG